MSSTHSRVAGTLIVCIAVVGWSFVSRAEGQRRDAKGAAAPAATDWPTYGHDHGGTRYSPLTQITPGNVAQLQPAWVYHMKGSAGANAAAGFSAGETTPLVIGGTMYVSTPYGRVVALDPTTGTEKWVFPLPSGSPSTRGVESFRGDTTTTAQIVFGSTDGKL